MSVVPVPQASKIGIDSSTLTEGDLPRASVKNFPDQHPLSDMSYGSDSEEYKVPKAAGGSCQ